MSLRSKFSRLFAATALVSGMFGASNAHAGFTTYQGTKPNEAKFEQVFEQAYGGNFVKSGNDFTNGLLTAIRVDDDHDKTFTGHILGGRMLARFAGYHQQFGLYDDGAYTNLMDLSGWGQPVSGTMDEVDLTGGAYKFGRAGGGHTYSSDPADNVDQGDHLLTYKLVVSDEVAANIAAAVPNQKLPDLYVLFWEDMPMNRGDRDYNDMVLELAVQPVAVPLPAAALMGGVMLLGVMARRRWKAV